jgi:hypothetical protein
LFGRAQDRLSHVLVPPPYESRPDFFYPVPQQEAPVHLGDIPFVRLRYGLPERVLQGRARFSEAVGEAQKAVPLALHLDPASRTVTAGGERSVLEPAQFALYWMMAERCIAAWDGVLRTDAAIKDELLGYYGCLVDVASRAYEKTRKAYRGFDADNFDQAKAKVKRALQRVLGERRASPYLIGKLDPVPGSRVHRFGLALPPEAITVAPATLRAQQHSPGRPK